MTWSTRRVLWLLGGLCVGLMAALAGTITTVSMLSARDQISLAAGIAVFVAVVGLWAVAVGVSWTRWWRWSQPDRQPSGRVRVLVAHGSRRGGTAQIARSIAEHLAAAGVPADVRPARDVARLAGYEVVVVGGALYRRRWHPDARRFVRRHARELRVRPVWLFASGPLDALASPYDRVPDTTVAAAAARVGARDVATFGGRLEPDASGFVARRMLAQGRGGDFRDPQQIRDWASRIAEELGRVEAGDVAPTR